MHTLPGELCPLPINLFWCTYANLNVQIAEYVLSDKGRQGYFGVCNHSRPNSLWLDVGQHEVDPFEGYLADGLQCGCR